MIRFFAFFVSICSAVMAPAQGLVALKPSKCTQAPEEFRLGSQGGLYVCKKTGCDGQASQGDMRVAATPSPTMAQVFCDGSYKLVVRFEGQVFSLEEFGTKDRCFRAVEQFKLFKGCYCTSEFAPKCLGVGLGGGYKFELVAPPFSRQDGCIQALEQMQSAVEVKAR